MPNKQKTTFQKRQKELARQEKQRKKLERRAERKRLRAEKGPEPDLILEESAGATLLSTAAGEDTGSSGH